MQGAIGEVEARQGEAGGRGCHSEADVLYTAAHRGQEAALGQVREARQGLCFPRVQDPEKGEL